MTMSVRRGLVARRSAAVALLLVFLATFAASPAQADPLASVAVPIVDDAPPSTIEILYPKDAILLSLDRVKWFTTLPGGLFDAMQSVVPGDSAERIFWVKNPLDTPANLQIRAIDIWGSNHEYNESVAIAGFTARGDAGVPVPIAELEHCAAIIPAVVIPPGGEVRVSLTLSMLDVPQRVAQNAAGGFDILVTMYLDGVPHPRNTCDPAAGSLMTDPAAYPASGGTASLAFTGSMIAGPLGLSVILIVLGAVFFIVRHRRAKEE